MNPAGQLDLTAILAPFNQQFYHRMPFVFLFMVAILLVKVSLRIIAARCANALGGRSKRAAEPGRTTIALVLLPISLGILYIGLEGAMPGTAQSFVTGVTQAWGG